MIRLHITFERPVAWESAMTHRAVSDMLAGLSTICVSPLGRVVVTLTFIVL